MKVARDRPSLVLTHLPGPLCLWAEAGTPLTTSDGGAVAVGLLFDRATGTRLNRLPDDADLAGTLIRRCWGAYVAIAPAGDGHWVLRDPSGSVPVYHGSRDGLELHASDSGMLGLAWGAFRANLEIARHWLQFPFLRTEASGAIGVSELLPGSLREITRAGASVRRCWLPSRFCASADISEEDAALLLREEVLRTVPRLAEGANCVTLRLSGGLDSSIVAAALAHAGVPFRAATFATRSAEGDERPFAREAANRYGVELIELNEAGMDLDLRGRGDPFRRPPSPLLQPLRLAFASLDLAGRDGIVVDGAGGDNVFAAISGASPVVDAFRLNGLAAGRRTARDVAELHGTTFWDVLCAASRRAWRGSRRGWHEDRTFLGPKSARERHHPWIEEARGLLPGRADHIRLVAGIHHFFADPAGGEWPTLHPLMAQPIVELCLRIPSWRWVAGGRDRAVARAAFRGLVPDLILDRRGKGSLEGMFMRGYLAKRAELRDFLLSGKLAEAGIIDPAALSAYLEEKSAPRDPLYIRILEIASAEQWLRSFCD